MTVKRVLGILLFSILFVWLLNACGQKAGSDAPVAPTRLTNSDDENFPWWTEAVFYEVFVRSFADSVSGPLAGDGIGDLQGLIEHLDYLNDGNPDTNDDLGITGIWLMPAMQSPSYHGYDITDYYTIERDYGTNEDFKRLIEATHKRGIRVIIDLVLNHVSRQHPWFKKGIDAASPYHGWFIWKDKAPDFRGPWGQEVWHETGSRFYYGIFWEGMPDLNYHNPEVTKEMYAVARFWLEEMEVDGFRLDAIRHLFEKGDIQVDVQETHMWLRGFFTFYKSIAPQAKTVGEIWADTETVSRYNTGDQLDLTFQFELAQAILNSAKSGLRDDISSTQSLVLEKFPCDNYATFITNHDQNRVMTQLDGNIAKAKLAASILLTSPGTPFIYYGEEIGMTGQKPDPKIRTPMQWTPGGYAGFSNHSPWQPVNDGYEEVNVKIQKADPDSLLRLYRKLIQLRNTHPALQVGDYIRVVNQQEQVYAFLRTFSGETILVFFNLGAEPVENYSLALPLPPECGNGSAKELLQGVEVTAPVLQKDGRIAPYKPVNRLAPRGAYVIRLWPR
jgi:glycosidase